ncbi:putative bifunctional diguanylate cyclase/phosphodiesterase [Chromobacterium alticapitis]|uniref:Diguanylate cyclase n=1 Tax=Chromobacterium alticapitis TaxID=2073169 RepID=A0A2S5DEH9_9NEIS|nr:EAL domain-containing protein [Chromobacterium alticapitis]POZ61506.1 diguanylate cyclase [Chromobacterium alticapitis]
MQQTGDILVVDDTTTTLMMLLALLSTQGYQVSSAQSGAEALNLAQKHPPDLILLDFNLPDTDGLAVCRELKLNLRTRDIPVLFLSSSADADARVDGFAAGAVDFIAKPFERSELLARISTHLELSRLKQRLSKLVEEKTDSLRLSEQRFRALIEQAPEAIMVYNLDSGRFVDANRQAELLTDRPLPALIGLSPLDIYSAEQPDGLPAAESVGMHAARALQGEVQVFERSILRPDGGIVPCEVRLSLLPSETGRLLRVSYIDITQRIAAQDKINRLAYFDALTGLYNQSGLMEQLDALCAIPEKERPAFALLLIDLGDFKYINDVYGNRIGDLLLCCVADRLRQLADAGGYAARLGGVEFVLLQTGIADVKEAKSLARRVLDAVTAPFPVDEMMLNIGANIGVSLGTAHGDSGQELLRNADMALYQSKQIGALRAEMYHADLGRQMRERVELEKELRHAIDSGQLLLHYQPQIELSSGRVVGVEALVRWQHAKRGMISPAQFIPIAEQSGLILPLGRWVLREACGQLRRWQDQGSDPDMKMAVNLSVAQFTDHELPDFVAGVLRETGIAPACLELEITESCTMLSPQQSINMMEQFRDMGVHSSIDDFGTGHSALAYLTRFPLDTLKIDQSFIRNISSDEKDTALCDTIAYLAHRLGLRVVAEGVETQQQLTFLTSIHVDVVQGYLLCKPLPAADLENFMLQRSGLQSQPGIEYF